MLKTKWARQGKRDDLGMSFRSSYEANYARYLNFLIRAGSNLVRWEYEPELFKFTEIKRGTRFYRPDFKIYLSNGHVEYHEVKGWNYPKGNTAIKRFQKYFPHLKLIIIDGSWFENFEKKGYYKGIPGWELRRANGRK